MDFTEINSRGKRGELLGRIDRQNSRFRTAKTMIIKFGLLASFVESESAKNALNEVLMREITTKTLLFDYYCYPTSLKQPLKFPHLESLKRRGFSPKKSDGRPSATGSRSMTAPGPSDNRSGEHNRSLTGACN
ncbi:hypothetical protein TNCV_1070441 [Trichonephila clavipes]|nr:hypothetical protein TNCV_1070441 [Trichonephila clavipes]